MGIGGTARCASLDTLLGSTPRWTGDADLSAAGGGRPGEAARCHDCVEMVGVTKFKKKRSGEGLEIAREDYLRALASTG